MDVQTADHTKQTLLPKAAPTPLGCSIARAGGKQHWTIYSVKAMDQLKVLDELNHSLSWDKFPAIW